MPFYNSFTKNKKFEHFKISVAQPEHVITVDDCKYPEEFIVHTRCTQTPV